MNEIVLTVFTNYVVPVLGSAIMALGTYGITLLNRKLNNEQVKQALEQLSKITKSVVQSLNQDIVAKIRAKRELTDIDKQEIKGKAIYLIKSQMQDDFLNLLDKNTIDVNQRINTEIESQVFEAKICAKVR